MQDDDTFRVTELEYDEWVLIVQFYHFLSKILLFVFYTQKVALHGNM